MSSASQKAPPNYRKVAAELIQRVPAVVEPLRDGRLCFTGVVELSKVLSPENADEVLPRFFHRSKQEAKAVSAELRPAAAAPHRDVVTALRAPARGAPAGAMVTPVDAPGRQVGTAAVHPDEPPRANETGSLPATPPAPIPVPSTRPRDLAEPLTADLRRLHMTVSPPFLEKLEAARAALSHSHPGASIEEILQVGLDLVLERHAKRRGIVKKPPAVPLPAKPAHVPAHVKAAVWKRDGGRCQWKLDSGEICASTLRVELDHVRAKARGGAATVEDLRCLCRVHNDLWARETFGDAWMNRFTRGLWERNEPVVPSAPPP